MPPKPRDRGELTILPRFFYSRFDESPRGKSGFHIAYWSEDYIQERELVEIETRIYWPQGVDLKEKFSLFPLSLSSGRFMALCFYRSRPDLRDKYGRGGIFEVLGLLIPMDIWRRGVSLLEIYNLVEFPSRETLEDNPQLEPLKLGLRKPDEVRGYAITSPEVNFSKFLVLTRKILTERLKGKVIIKLPKSLRETFRFIESVYLYLDPISREKLSLDTGFDMGNLFYTDHKLLGYLEVAPRGEFLLQIDLGDFHSREGLGRIPGSESTEELFKPSDLYDKWLLSEVLEKRSLKLELLELIWRLGRVIEDIHSSLREGTLELGDYLKEIEDLMGSLRDLPPSFWEVSSEEIEEISENLLKLSFKGELNSKELEILKRIASWLKPEDKLILVFKALRSSDPKEIRLALLSELREELTKAMNSNQLEKLISVLSYEELPLWGRLAEYLEETDPLGFIIKTLASRGYQELNDYISSARNEEDLSSKVKLFALLSSPRSFKRIRDLRYILELLLKVLREREDLASKLRPYLMRLLALAKGQAEEKIASEIAKLAGISKKELEGFQKEFRRTKPSFLRSLFSLLERLVSK